MQERRRQYLEMMGLEEFLRALDPTSSPAVSHERPPVPVHLTGVVERPRYRIEKLYYESLPRLYVTANLYLPTRQGAVKTGPRAGVLYVCGHSDTQKVHYQAHARKFAQLGFACLIVETVQLGEVRGYHHGVYREGWHHWTSRGYSPAAIEAINGMRGLDLLAQRPDVDGGKLGVTGISGGGAVTWWVAAADERIQAAASVCGTSTLASYIADRTIDGHCDCMWLNNTYRWDLVDVGALIAPRPFVIASQDRDPLFTIASVRKVHRQLKQVYTALGAADRLKLIVTPGGHAYHPKATTGIFSWFAKHLQGRAVPPERIGDVDETPASLESAETLRVFVNGPLKEDRTPTIQDDIFTPPAPPEIADAEGLKAARVDLVARLRKRTFGAFPADPPPLDARVEYELADERSTGFRLAYTSEEGWRLRAMVLRPVTAEAHAPAVIALRSPDEEFRATDRFAGSIHAPWVRVFAEPRGTGDTSWGQDIHWHVRRCAAWTGRTIASMRVWDVLRTIGAVRELPGVDPARIGLAARGEMCAVALYAALLNGRIATLLLDSPPATQNAPDRKDGRGTAIEMLNCLKVTDLAQVAGLLFPAEIVIAGERPESYGWAEALYRRQGQPERFRAVKDLTEWSAR
ncbi:MAG TPA: hypothetical protein VKT77_03445, partial [Chthonomonadaceae bacterium]|nr:hypothetical protein [Chthonomonadaceae bacterium]